MARKTFRGAAADLTLANSLTSGTATIQCNGDASGWPDGADGNEFVLQLEPDTDNAETVLCATLTTGAPSSIAVLSRGWDGTAAVAHSPNVIVRHVLDADTIDDFGGHLYDPARDDHAQYLNQTRHDVTARHAFGPTGALGVPGTPADISDTASTGAAAGPARADHVHAIPAKGVTNGMLADGAVDARALLAGAIVDPLVYASPIAPIIVSATAPTAPTAPPTLGMRWLKPAASGHPDRWYYFDGTNWRPDRAGALATSSYAGTLSASLTPGTIPNLVATFDEDAMLSGGTTLTIPTVAGYDFSGRWRFFARANIADATTLIGGALYVRKGASTYYAVEMGHRFVGHSLVLAGWTEPIDCVAGDAFQLAPAQDSTGNANQSMSGTHTLAAEYLGKF